MALHPQIAAGLAAFAEAKIPALETLTPARARDIFDAMLLARGGAPAAVGRVEPHRAEHGGIGVPVRIYWPDDADRRPAVIYFHGGGHVFGNVETHDAVARNMCELSQAVVVSVDYRLAPEHPFPAAIEDAWSVYMWLREGGAALGIDTTRLAVAGDSAGGNIAAVLALLARDAGHTDLRMQALIYPVTDYTLAHDSYRRFGQGYGILTPAAMQWFRQHYLADPDQARDWRASPLLRKDLGGLPPALVVSAQCDVLRDEGFAYAEALRQAGNAVDYREYGGTIHGFFAMAPAVDVAVRAQAEVGDELRRALGT
ncbi:alpha/beta hydrolase [Enterovirga sp.]|jgi:acetyl esterase|uniref:alpha/beta hydrolase n=1 Tax=Enterovirga sp. TaxID=2026350 RepID=UPI002615A59D|nr:alpha/beta hydrolase [Enterovirga sp.]MDB5592031.1 acetylhydrolase [Enterovirga sp.]